MTESPTEVAAEVRPTKIKRIRKTIFHPSTTSEKVLCALFWLVLAGAAAVVSIYAVPRFFKNVVKPFLDLCKVQSFYWHGTFCRGRFDGLLVRIGCWQRLTFYIPVVQERLSKPQIAAICFAALSILPLTSAQPHIFIWLATATLGTGWALLLTLVSALFP